MNMDIIYVVYFDGEMYKDRGRKSTYLKLGNAKQIVSSDSKYIAQCMCENEKIDWYDLDKEQREEWLDKAKQRFEIKEFVERVK